jgi:aspartyl-tRNA(Asn)/glutamyl-tRNA(Gln) amidotransferase subunit A
MHTKTLKELSALLQAKQVSASELARLFLDRIRKSDLNAFIDVN